MITIEEARAFLVLAGSEASDVTKFSARRAEHGWIFSFILGAETIPVGTGPWVVCDNGQVRKVPLGSAAQKTLHKMISK